MAERYEIQIAIHRFIHNDLELCARDLRERVRRKFESGEAEGFFSDMMGSLIFMAFTIEANVNFIGWKTLDDGWPDRASLSEKINLLVKVLPLELEWKHRPLQTILKLNNFRNSIAHGKPKIVDPPTLVQTGPEALDLFKGEWESCVTQEFIDRSYEDMNSLWNTLLEAAKIPIGDTVTRSFQSSKLIREE